MFCFLLCGVLWCLWLFLWLLVALFGGVAVMLVAFNSACYLR